MLNIHTRNLMNDGMSNTKVNFITWKIFPSRNRINFWNFSEEGPISDYIREKKKRQWLKTRCVKASLGVGTRTVVLLTLLFTQWLHFIRHSRPASKTQLPTSAVIRSESGPAIYMTLNHGHWPTLQLQHHASQKHWGGTSVPTPTARWEHTASAGVGLHSWRSAAQSSQSQ